ncbi:MAG: hypothetical protein ACMUIA_12590 [bacterium]
MGKKVAMGSILCFLIAIPWLAEAASIRKGFSFELKGGFYRPRDYDKWDEAFGKGFSGFGGLKLNQEIMKNIELGLSADYMRASQSDWSFCLVPIALNFTYAMRSSQDQFLVPFLGGGVDFVYGRTSMMELSNIKPHFLKEPGFHLIAGARMLLDNMGPDEALSFDEKFGVNNSYLVFEARYLQLFTDYTDLEFTGQGTGYLDPKGVFVSIGILVEF